MIKSTTKKNHASKHVYSTKDRTNNMSFDEMNF